MVPIRSLAAFAKIVVAPVLVASAVTSPAKAQDGPSWRVLLDAAARLDEEQPSPRQAFDPSALTMAARDLTSDPVGAVQAIRAGEPVLRERMTIPLEAADLETVLRAVIAGGFADAPALPLSEEDAVGVRGMFEQMLGDAALDPRFVPDALAYGAVSGWLILDDQLREVAYEATMLAVRDQIILGELSRMSLTAKQENLRALRNAVLAEVFLVEEADRAARRADEGSAFRDELAAILGPRYRGLRLGPASGLVFGPNLFEPVE